MGSAFTKFLNLFSKKQMKALVLGLDAAGKTSAIYRIKQGKVESTTPTIGINIQTLQVKNIRLTVWDIGQQQKIRQLLRHYYPGTQAIIYVVDSADRERIDLAKKQLEKLLNQDELRDAVLLVLSNKKDLQGRMEIPEVCEKLGLSKLKSRVWYVQDTSVLTGEGLRQGLQWLGSVIK